MADKSNINNYKTIIWDWNGTLLNDVWLCVEIVNKLLENHNQLQLDEAGYKQVFGFPIVEYYQKIGIDLKKESFEELTQKFIPKYEAKVKQCQLHEKAIHILDKFHHTKSNQFILTAGHKENVSRLLEHHSINKYFTEVEGLDNHRAESKLERGRQLIQKYQINKKEAVLIGDTIHDFEVANEIGVDCILIANGHQSKKRLEKKVLKRIEILDEIGDLSNFKVKRMCIKI